MPKPANPHIPTADHARRAASAYGGCDVAEIDRFPTGINHYVYDVLLADGRRLAVRLTTPERKRYFTGALYWYERLLPLDIPLAKILHSDLTPHFPVMIVERLPGTDLGGVYDELSAAQKRELARRVADIQIRVGTLPDAAGFGWAMSYDDPGLRAYGYSARYWREQFDWTRDTIADLGHCDPAFVDRVAALFPAFADYFADLKPRPSIEDTTTKNVIVHQGALSGIVDVDCVFFGDRLQVVGLTQMSLLASGRDIDYIEYWCEFMGVDDTGRRAVDFHSASYGLAFMTEIGQALNKGEARVDRGRVDSLHRTLDALLVKLGV